MAGKCTQYGTNISSVCAFLLLRDTTLTSDVCTLDLVEVRLRALDKLEMCSRVWSLDVCQTLCGFSVVVSFEFRFDIDLIFLTLFSFSFHVFLFFSRHLPLHLFFLV